MRAAAKEAIAVRPIPELAARTGAAVAAALALKRSGLADQAGHLLASVEQTVVEANGGLLFALLSIKRPRDETSSKAPTSSHTSHEQHGRRRVNST